MSQLIAELEELNNTMSAAPWNESAMYDAIRHVQRNTDVMQDALEYVKEGEPMGLPDRYDGGSLAKLRNLLPAIISALKDADHERG